MNGETGFRIPRCLVGACRFVEDPRGARHWGIFVPQTSHEGRTVKAPPLSMWRIGECSHDVERCLTTRAPVASLVLRPSRSSFFV
jgi:hypothetical protein